MSAFISLENFLSDELLELYQRIKCPKCNTLLKDPQIGSCGHSLCKDCADALLYCAQYSDKKMSMCPQKDCKGLIDGKKYFSDNETLRKEVERFLMTLMECCIRDCAWKGPIRHYEDHIARKHPPSLMQDLPRKNSTHSITDVTELLSASQTMKEEIGKSVEDFVDRITNHGVANVGSSRTSFDSGNCSSKSLEQTTQPTMFLNITDRFNSREVHLDHGMPDTESGNWTGEGSQMVSGNTGLKLPSVIGCQNNTLASHGNKQAEKQLTSKQGPSIDRGQHHMVKKEASCRQTVFDHTKQQPVVKQRHSRSRSFPSHAVMNLSKGTQHHLLETTTIPKNSGNQANQIKRRASFAPSSTVDMPTTLRKRPMSATFNAKGGLSSKQPLPSLTNGTSTVSPKRKARLNPPTSCECCIGCKCRDLKIQQLEAELKKLKAELKTRK